jgi:hypothetical protein
MVNGEWGKVKRRSKEVKEVKEVKLILKLIADSWQLIND